MIEVLFLLGFIGILFALATGDDEEEEYYEPYDENYESEDYEYEERTYEKTHIFIHHPDGRIEVIEDDDW